MYMYMYMSVCVCMKVGASHLQYSLTIGLTVPIRLMENNILVMGGLPSFSSVREESEKVCCVKIITSISQLSVLTHAFISIHCPSPSNKLYTDHYWHYLAIYM